MPFPEYTGETTIIGALATYAKDRGLTGQETQDKFDEGLKNFVAWFNETHLKEIFRPAGIINGNFRHPVNQYGRVSGAAFSSVGNYFVDMWKLNMGSVTWTAGTGFSLNGMMTQYFEAVPTDLFGETIPITINVGGVDYVKHMTFPNDTSSYDTEKAGGVTINIGFSTKTATLCDVSVTHVPYISLTTSSAVTIKYIYSVAPPADYGEEMRKCQRYFYRTGVSSFANASVFPGNGTVFGLANAKFPVSMRIAPTVTFYSILGTEGKVTHWASGQDYADISVQSATGTGKEGFGIIESSLVLSSSEFYAFHYEASANL